MHKIVSHLERNVEKMEEIERVVRSCGITNINENTSLDEGSFIIRSSVTGKTFSIEWYLEVGSVDLDEVEFAGDLKTEWGNVCIPRLEFELWYLYQENLLSLSFDPEDGEWEYTNDSYGVFEGSKINLTFDPLSLKFPDGVLEEKDAFDFISMITVWFWKNKNATY